MSMLMPVLHCPDYCSFVVRFEIKTCESSNSILPFQDRLGYSRSLEILYEFYNQFFHIFKKTHWDFDKDGTEFVDHFGEYHHLNIRFSNP